MENIEAVIRELQSRSLLPEEDYTHDLFLEQFSHVYRVSFKNKSYFFKFLKEVHDHDEKTILNKFTQEVAALQKLFPYFSNSREFTIPKVVYSSDEPMVLVTEEVKGLKINLKVSVYMNRLNIIRKMAHPETMRICGQLGKAVRKIHQYEEYPFTAKDLEALSLYIKKRLLKGSTFGEKEQNHINHFIESNCSAILDNLPAYRKTLVHGDINLFNIFFDGKTLTLIDFGNSRIDHYYQDICCFYLMLFGMFSGRVKYSLKAKKEVFNAFCQGYGVQWDVISEDFLWKLILLKNLSIFLKTFIYRMEAPIAPAARYKTIRMIKNRIFDYIDFRMTRRAVLEMVSVS